jgi:hypothetical protein
LAFQLLTGELPFQADSFIAVVQHHYMTAPPDIRQARKDVPKALLDVVYRALAKKPEGRFATTHDMVRALEAVPISADEKHKADQQLRGLSKGQRFSEIKTEKLPPPTPPTPMPGATGMVVQQPEAKKRSGVAVAAALLIVVGGGGGVAAWQMGVFGSSDSGATGQPASPQTPPPVQQQVLLNFTGIPSGAEIRVNDERVNGTSHAVAPNATYSYVVTAQGYRACRSAVAVLEALNQNVAIAADCLTPIRQTQAPTQPRPQRVTQTGALMIRVTVSGATATMDGNPLELNKEIQVPVGSHRIRVTAAGCQPFETTVDVTTATPTRQPVRLACND